MPALNDILNRHDRRKDITTAITMQAGRWQGEMAMCPIVLGAALCDDAHRLLNEAIRGGAGGTAAVARSVCCMRHVS